MGKEGTLFPTPENLVAIQYALTAVSSGFNAIYFLGYRSAERRRRIGAMVLSLVSLGLLIQSVFFGLFVFLRPSVFTLFEPRQWLVVGALPFMGSGLISALILRRTSFRGK